MPESVKEVKNKLNDCDKGGLSAFILAYETDSRRGVQTLVQQAKRRLEKIQNEEDRILHMRQFDAMYRKDLSLLCGIDEAGRGPLAGPVVAGAVIFPKDADILYINDSKQLSEGLREKLFDEIKSKAIAVGVGIATEIEIDSVNILQATFLAMKRAVSNLSVAPEVLLNDAVIIPDLMIPQEKIIKGDAKSFSIAAASIIAKVTRDRLMIKYDEEYPGYGFKMHKGYGTKAHYEAIRKQGICPIHRKTFLKNI